MNDTVGVRIRRFREAAKLTLEQLAEQVGSSKSYMWELESKENARPSAAMVERLAAALGVTTEEIVSGVAPPDARDKVFFRDYQTLQEPDKARLQRILKALREG